MARKKAVHHVKSSNSTVTTCSLPTATLLTDTNWQGGRINCSRCQIHRPAHLPHIPPRS